MSTAAPAGDTGEKRGRSSPLRRPRFPPCACPPPSEEACRALWDKYGMPPHIRRHSEQVARFAVDVAHRAVAAGFCLNPEGVRACALLHDIAKSYTILHGGSHAQLGAAWVVAETGHAGVAQGVLYHVHWPWSMEEEEVCSLPFPVMYADKRTLHDGYVTIPERYEDLLVRYGATGKARRAIRASRRQALFIESALSAKLGMRLDAYTPDSGRLVP